MSDVVRSSVESEPIWRRPEVQAAPFPFRTFVKLAARQWRSGVFEITPPEGAPIVIRGPEPGPHGRLIVRDYRFVGRVLTSGDIGFAEGFMAGEWDTPDLSALLEVLALNYERLTGLVKGKPLVRALNLMVHALRRNSRAGARKNIQAHYDLGNSFYEQWLDETMTYSSARFETADQPLSDAQRRKYRTLAQAMDLREGHHVLEIGCGWGGFAEFAAGEIGAKVTGVTISPSQYEFAVKRLADKGLSDRAEIRLIDYRDVEGAFDRVASIEMFEAVGEEYWPAYFGKIRDVLKPGGRAALQIITIRDESFDEYRRRMDFIQKYVFPGGVLPSEARLKEETARASLSWDGVERFGVCYADTLKLWAERFQGAWETIRPLGFDDSFRRLWLFYLAYCEAGFRTGRTNVIQLALGKA